MAVELFAYGDESGLHKNPRYCLMCGFIASPRQWKIFNKSWKNVLDQFGISDFHSTEFFPRDENKKRIKQGNKSA